MDASVDDNYAIRLEPNGLNHERVLFPTNCPSSIPTVYPLQIRPVLVLS